MSRAPQFSVVTPSYNMLRYLQRACASVMDQHKSLEHIIIDGGSSDGTPEWLASRSELTSVVEPDRGMYDAINKGLRRARGEYISYLNCDEQYLPGTLDRVDRFFATHPGVDIVFGDALLIRPDGSLIAYRKGFKPRWPYIVASHLYVLSCTMFFRRRVVEDGYLFDSTWRDTGDAEFVVRVLRAGYRAAHIPHFLSAFTMTGANMSTGPNARAEEALALKNAPRWVRQLRLPLNAIRLAEKALRGAYRQRFPLEYALFANDDDPVRSQFVVNTASFRWPAP